MLAAVRKYVFVGYHSVGPLARIACWGLRYLEKRGKNNQRALMENSQKLVQHA